MGATRASRRWQQQHRAFGHIGRRLDGRIRHGKGMCLGGCLNMSKIRGSEPCDVDGSRVISIGRVRTVFTKEPTTPLDGFRTMFHARRAVRVGRLCAAGAGMRRSSWPLGTKADACQVAFVPKNAPNLTSNRGVIPPVSPAPTHSSPSPRRLERFQRFSTDQAAPEGRSQ